MVEKITALFLKKTTTLNRGEQRMKSVLCVTLIIIGYVIFKRARHNKYFAEKCESSPRGVVGSNRKKKA